MCVCVRVLIRVTHARTGAAAATELFLRRRCRSPRPCTLLCEGMCEYVCMCMCASVHSPLVSLCFAEPNSERAALINGSHLLAIGYWILDIAYRCFECRRVQKSKACNPCACHSSAGNTLPNTPSPTTQHCTHHPTPLPNTHHFTPQYPTPPLHPPPTPLPNTHHPTPLYPTPPLHPPSTLLSNTPLPSTPHLR